MGTLSFCFRDKCIPYYREVTIMSFIKNVVGVFALGAAYMIGVNTGIAVWEAGLDDVVEQKAKKLFSRKDKEELY